MGMYDHYVYTNGFDWEMEQIRDVLQENWNKGYDEGQSFGVKEVLDALRTIIKYTGGINEEVIDIILDAEYNEVQEYADELEREIHIGDEISFRALDFMDDGESTKGIVLSMWETPSKVKGFTVYAPCDGYFYSDDIGNVRKTGKHFDIEDILNSMKEGREKNDVL